MTPRRKYDLATAGWCVAWAVGVYMLHVFVIMEFVNPLDSVYGRFMIAAVAFNVTAWVPWLREEKRPK